MARILSLWIGLYQLWLVCDSLDFIAKESASVAADQNLWCLDENVYPLLCFRGGNMHALVFPLPWMGPLGTQFFYLVWPWVPIHFKGIYLLTVLKIRCRWTPTAHWYEKEPDFQGLGGDGGGGGSVFVLETTELGKRDSGRHVCSKPVTDIILPLISGAVTLESRVHPEKVNTSLAPEDGGICLPGLLSGNNFRKNVIEKKVSSAPVNLESQQFTGLRDPRSRCELASFNESTSLVQNLRKSKSVCVDLEVTVFSPCMKTMLPPPSTAGDFDSKWSQGGGVLTKAD